MEGDGEPNSPQALASPRGRTKVPGPRRVGSCLRGALRQPHQQRLIEGKPGSRRDWRWG